jgi:hypothetical protein
VELELLGIVGLIGEDQDAALLGPVGFTGVEEDSDSGHVVEELLGRVGLTGVEDEDG